MDLHRSPLRLLDVKLERLEHEVGAEPNVLVLTSIEVGLEHVGVLRPDHRVGAIRGQQHEVILLAQLFAVGCLRPVVDRHAELVDPVLKYLEELLAAHGRETLSADGERVSVELDVDVGPSCEPAPDQVVDDRVHQDRARKHACTIHAWAGVTSWCGSTPRCSNYAGSSRSRVPPRLDRPPRR